MLGGWVNPHKEQQTIPQGQTSIPPKSVSTPTANGQIAPWSDSARGVGRGAGSHTPSTASESTASESWASSTDSTRSTHFTLTQRHRWKETDGKVCGVYSPPQLIHLNGEGDVVVGCKIPRKENSPILWFFFGPPPSCFPGFTRGWPDDRSKHAPGKKKSDWLKLLAGFTRKKASTRRVNRKLAHSTRNQRVFFSRYFAANYGTYHIQGTSS